MSTSLKPGQLLKNGEIEIVDLVGSGSIGEVYRAYLLREGERQLVAVKYFNAEKIQKYDIDAIEVVHRESLAISRIDHPSIVKIKCIDLDSKFPFIVEEFLAGGDLAKGIAARKRLNNPSEPIYSPLELASMGQQICAGLMLIHQKNQYHGDLKPQNICFRDDQQKELVIIDFGKAGFLEGNLLDRHEILTTLAYLPPERTGFVKMAGSANSDLYSLGVTLFEAAVGRIPFSANDNREMINRLLFEVPKPLSAIFPGFPQALSDIISKLLRKNPPDRYHSAFGLSADLERCIKALAAGEEPASFALGTKDKLRELNYRIPMVGRDQEIDRLHTLFDESLADGGSVALIGAPSGTGKSRLAFEIIHRAQANLCLISYVKFSEFERNLPLSAITLLLVEHAHYLKTRSAADIQRWQQKISERLGARSQLIADRYPCYEGLLPSFSQRAATGQDQEFQVFNQCLSEFLSLLSASGEVQLVVIDDLQWADWQSLQVLGVMADAIWRKQTKRIMLVGTYRSNEVGFDHPLNKALLDECPKISLLELGPLHRDASNQLIQILLDEGGAEVAKLQDLTYKLTAGNPFFIYEYLKSAIHTGIFAFDQQSKTWHFDAKQIHQASLSAGVAGLVADRIRTLSPIDQALISIASLSGQAMPRAALIELLSKLLELRAAHSDPANLPDKEQSIELAYQGLLQKNLLVSDNVHFRFFHDKIQEAAYSLLSEAEKVVLHPAYGLWCALDLKAHEESSNEAQVFEAAYHLCKGNRKILSAVARKFLCDAAKMAQSVFAYDKAREYLNAAVEALDSQSGITLEERFETLVLLANTLSISDQISEAMELYDKLLEFECTPLQRATIYCKKCEFAHSLFEYKQARDASAAGLKSLGTKIMTKELSSYLYILFFFPILVIYACYFRYFGRQTKEIRSDEDKIRFLLLLKNEISQFFTVPIAAIANIIKLNFELMSYKDCETRAIMFGYWGVAASAFGFTKLGGKFFAKAYEFFDRTGNPVDKGFVLFCWGLVCDMSIGDLPAAQKKLDEAVRTLAPIGESFWRSISLVGLVLIDYYGGETGEAGIRSYDLIELWKRVRFAATPLGTTIRHYLEEERLDQVAYILEATTLGEKKIRDEGFESIDSIFALLSVGEHYEMLGDYPKAEELLQRATWMGTRRLHRMSYAAYAPIVYVRTLIHQKKLLKAIIPLAFCWINQLFNIRLFRPQTLFVSGYWLSALGLKTMGLNLIESGIDYASKRHWATIVAEGSLLMGRLLVDSRPEIARVHIKVAYDHFQLRNWRFHSKLCEQLMNQEPSAPMMDTTVIGETSVQSTLMTRRAVGKAQAFEFKSLLNILLDLSLISEQEKLFNATMEAMCKATGSEFALLIFQDGQTWSPGRSFNIVMDSEEQYRNLLDFHFIEKSIEQKIQRPEVRPLAESLHGKHLSISPVMMVPLVYESRTYAYCYLAASNHSKQFDEQNIEVAGPIGIQTAITLQKIILNEQLAVERDQLSQLHHTLEQKVVEQTRDIKTIMQHIKIGICTVSGPSISIDKDYSQVLEQLLGQDTLKNKPLLPLLFDHSELKEDEKDQAKNALSFSLSEHELAFSMNEHILPRLLSGETDGHKPFTYELGWIPVTNEAAVVEKILLTVNDVTALRGLEQQASKKSQELQIISEIIGCSSREWLLFSKSCTDFVHRNTLCIQNLVAGYPADAQLREIFVNVHTIKGNARALGCKFMSEMMHGVEQYFAETIRCPPQKLDFEWIHQELERVAETIQRYVSIAEEKLGRMTQGKQTVGVPRETLLAFYKLSSGLKSQGINQAEALRKPLIAMRELLFLSLKSVFNQVFSATEALAFDLGKNPVSFKVDLPDLRVTDQGEELLRNIFVHLLRNTLDHGIESPDERLAQNKSAYGLIELTGRIMGQWLELRFTDDGRGLNLNKIRDIGLERGLLMPNQSKDDGIVASLIFSSGLSSAETLSEISGRGVGMNAVVDSIQASGGAIHIEFIDDRQVLSGFRACAFVITLPIDLFPFQFQGSMAA